MNKLQHGTHAWFAMVGKVLCAAAARADLPAGFTVSLVEHYTDGTPLGAALTQGLRFEIVDGQPSFRAGVREGEIGDVTIEITADAAHRLNRLATADPAYAAELIALKDAGQMTVEGDPGLLGTWFAGVHDEIVAQTL